MKKVGIFLMCMMLMTGCGVNASSVDTSVEDVASGTAVQGDDSEDASMSAEDKYDEQLHFIADNPELWCDESILHARDADDPVNYISGFYIFVDLDEDGYIEILKQLSDLYVCQRLTETDDGYEISTDEKFIYFDEVELPDPELTGVNPYDSTLTKETLGEDSVEVIQSDQAPDLADGILLSADMPTGDELYEMMRS